MAIELGGGGADRFSLGQVNRTQQSLLADFQKLSSGNRLVSSQPAAAGLAVAQRLTALETALNQGVRNLNDGISVAQVAEGGLTQVSEGLQRMRELTVQASNGTLNDADRQVIQEEFDQIAAQITQVSESTEFNGRSLLNGDASGAEAVEFKGGSEGGEPVMLDVPDQSAASLGVEGLDVSDPNSLQAIDDALSRVSSTRGDVGATINRLGSQVRNELVAQEAAAAARSRIEDTDIAEATSSRTKNEILLQAQLGLQAHSRIAESTTLQLLG